MEKDQYLKRYLELIETISKKEAVLESLIQSYLEGKCPLTLENLSEAINIGREQIELLKKESANYLDNYEQLSVSEALQEQNLKIIDKSPKKSETIRIFENLMGSANYTETKSEKLTDHEIELINKRTAIANGSLSINDVSVVKENLSSDTNCLRK